MLHQPVLLNEVIKFLDPKPGEFIIDGTVGGGGHMSAILEKIMPSGKFLGIDWDETMTERLRSDVRCQMSNVTLTHGNYADLPKIIAKEKFGKADGLLLDLGFSSDQLAGSGKGFSFERDEPLIMTYAHDVKPVKQILREIDTRGLAKIIFDLSGEKLAMRIARAIEDRGKRKAIETTGELAEIIRAAVPKWYERGRIDPATRTFQALRIYANHELENLERTLENLTNILKPGGRAAIISFHSLEDRIVKHSFNKLEEQGKLRVLTKKPIEASAEEVHANQRSRSAKLRAVVMNRSETTNLSESTNEIHSRHSHKFVD